MKVQKFIAPSTREALKNVRESLGPDAIILSSRQVDGAIEIIATTDIEIGAMHPGDAVPGKPVREHEAPVSPPVPQMDTNRFTRQPVHGATPSAQPAVFAPASPTASLDKKTLGDTAPGNKTALAGSAADYGVQMAGLLHEMKHLHGMMAGQLAGLSWGQIEQTEPSKTELLRCMFSAGFSPSLCREITQRLPDNLAFEQRLALAERVLACNLRTASAEDDLVNLGGLYALVGPTGVGKTTTIAKIAARCALQNGAASVALLTTDNYRIGAHEQLRVYAKILGVPAYSVKDADDLQGRLEELSDRHLVLIDTAGMSQRDKRLIDQAQMLSQAKRRVQRLLLLNATALGPTLEDVVTAYSGEGLDGCILTKVDETLQLAAVLDVVIRQRLKLYYVTNGQRVPEDLHLADAAQLVEQALEPMAATPFHIRDGEFPLMMVKASAKPSYTSTTE